MYSSDSSSDIVVLSNTHAPIVTVSDNSAIKSSNSFQCSQCVQNEEMERRMNVMRETCYNLQYEVYNLKFEISNLKSELEMKGEVNKEEFIELKEKVVALQST